jgi:hypothetical protein
VNESVPAQEHTHTHTHTQTHTHTHTPTTLAIFSSFHRETPIINNFVSVGIPEGDYSLVLVCCCVCACVCVCVRVCVEVEVCVYLRWLPNFVHWLFQRRQINIYSVPYIEEGARGQDKENSKGNVYACNSW